DVVRLPLPRRAHRIDQRRVLSVKSPRLAVGVGVGLVAVQHLHLVAAHDLHATVAAALAGAAGRRRRGPLDVKLAVAERLLRHNVAGLGADDQLAVLHFPARLAALGALPLREVLAVEEDDGVGRGLAGLALGALGARGYDAGVR